MKALLLGGGKGNRLKPVTDFINKHEIQICGKSLAEHALCSIIDAGITDIIATKNNTYSDSTLLQKLKDKYHSQANITIVDTITQGVAGEIIQTAKYLVGNNFVVVFGDTLFENNSQFKNYIASYKLKKYDGMMLLGHATNPARHCTPIFGGDKVVKVIEKFKEHTHDWVVTTWDIFPSWILKTLTNMHKSARGEYEMADLRNLVIQKGVMGYFKVQGWWVDAGIEKDLFNLNQKILNRDNAGQSYLGAQTKIINSQLKNCSVDGKYSIVNSQLDNCILMGKGQVQDQNLTEKFIFNGKVIDFTS